MSEIGIMTWFEYHNYGTALQVTALSETVKRLGHTPVVIRYYTRPYSPVTWEGSCGSYLTSLVRRKLQSLRNAPYLSEEREQKFLRFLSDHLQFTSECRLKSELESLNQRFDRFVCGSDQIWAPSCFDPRYFLDFVSDDRKKVAYAPSIGLPRVEDEAIRREMGRLAASFAWLSTREESGSAILRELTGREVKTVLDPTMLLSQEDWDGFASGELAPPETPYLLVYLLGGNGAHWRAIRRIAKALSLEVKIIPVFQRDRKRPGCIQTPVGPAEFLTLLRSAAYVCTDSFHGMVFSTLFNRQFTEFQRFRASDKRNQNSRIFNLAEKLGLSDRIWHGRASLSMLHRPIDYAVVDQKREALVDESLAYLKTALAGEIVETRKNNLARDYSLCCGCGACAAACPVDAIAVERDANGFYSARIDNETCISCGKCRNVCPYVRRENDRGIAEGELWSFKSKSDAVLKRSSSGGAAYHLSQMLLSQGYSVVGCTFDVERQQARHIIVPPDRGDELTRLSGSKYMQSEFAPAAGELYRKKDGKFLVVGTPCQIAGMRNLLRDRTDVVYADLICHGVPSYHLYEKYRDYLARTAGIDPKRLEVIFRDKRYGWRERYISCRDANHERSAFQNDDPYFLAFEHGFCYSHGCFSCPWRDSSAADLRLGDYWGNKFRDDQTGVSEVTAMTETGRRLIAELQATGQAELAPQPITDYTLVQQMTNLPEPPFWQAYVDALADPQKTLESVTEAYVAPAERKKKYDGKIGRLIRLIRR